MVDKMANPKKYNATLAHSVMNNYSRKAIFKDNILDFADQFVVNQFNYFIRLIP